MIDCNQILDAVCECCNITHKQIRSASRQSNIVLARKYFAYFVDKYRPDVTTKQASKFINRDRSSYSTLRSSVKSLVEVNYPDVNNSINVIDACILGKKAITIYLEELNDGDLMTVKKILNSSLKGWKNRESNQMIDQEIANRISVNK